MALKTIHQADLNNKVVLIRADLNVPLQNGQILDQTRIDRFRPTLDHVLSKGGKVILMTHLGRPKGQVVDTLSLKPIAQKLEEMGYTTHLFPLDTPPQEMKAGEVYLLENIRFHEGEEKNDQSFAQQLANLGGVYINDAFSVSHRAHASVEAITHLLPSYAGLQLESEVTNLTQAFENPERPLMAIVAGAKVSTKLSLLQSLSQKVDTLVIDGGLAHTFLAAQGYPKCKNSLCEDHMIPLAKEILETAKAVIILPLTIKVADEIAPGQTVEEVSAQALTTDKVGVDMGEKTLELVKEKIDMSKTLIWNGVVGVFEIPPFDASTLELARHIANRTQQGKLYSVAGGGETLAGLNKAGVQEQFSYTSTAGGAFLEFLEGKPLPGVKALVENEAVYKSSNM